MVALHSPSLMFSFCTAIVICLWQDPLSQKDQRETRSRIWEIDYFTERGKDKPDEKTSAFSVQKMLQRKVMQQLSTWWWVSCSSRDAASVVLNRFLQDLHNGLLAFAKVNSPCEENFLWERFQKQFKVTACLVQDIQKTEVLRAFFVSVFSSKHDV